MTQRGTHAVHRGIAAAQHHNIKPSGVDKRFVRQFIQPHNLFRVGNQERQRIIYARRIFVWQVGLHGTVCADADKNRIVLIQQRRQPDVFADFAVQFKMNSHRAEDFATARQQ